MRRFGLIGFPLGHSFSARFFAEKFERENIHNCRYDNYPIESTSMLPTHLDGFNVTIPYKEQIIPRLDALSDEAEVIGAVNCVANHDGHLTGHNTDAYGFRISLLELIGDNCPSALILGTGGASKAVRYVLGQLGISYTIVSRRHTDTTIAYEEINQEIMKNNLLIINTTPLGTFPNTDTKPDILYQYLTNRHMLFDLVYNPPLTAFLKEGKCRGARIKNGYRMLVMQAEHSWEIWND